MKFKSLVTLLAAITLITGTAFAQQSTPQAAEEPMENAFELLIDGGYLGVYAENITRENMGRYNLSQPRGVGITQVIKDSPAEKAGLRKDDVILRVDGESITSVRKLNRLISEIAPDQTTKITFSRAGSEQEVAATIAKRQTFGNFEAWTNKQPRIWKWESPLGNEGDLVFALGNSRRIGISTTELTDQLAEYFGVTGGKGVLVTSVTADGPAARAGLKAGDVITSIDGEPVDSTGDISRIINRKKDGDVGLTIIRNRSQQTIRVTPREGGLQRGTVLRPQIGRTIRIPRIEFPTMPEVNISIPAVTIPAVPSVNIQMPRITMPRVKVVRGSMGPI